MNVEFHYYTIFYLAVKAGFPHQEAEILATSSQMVDSNVLFFEIKTPRGLIRTEVTQNYGYWEEDTLEKVYLPFHFFPGEGIMAQKLRQDEVFNPLVVTPNSQCVKELLQRSLETKNLYRIGIALHTFADSWAHQNFSGKQELFNNLDPNSMVPAVGHAQAGRSPDQWDSRWTDPRLKESTVVNLPRYREAAQKIFRYLCIYKGKDFEVLENEVLNHWEELLEKGREGRNLEERMIEFVLQGIPPYDRRSWLEEAVTTNEGGWDDEGLFDGYDKVLWLMDRLIFKNKILKKDALSAKPHFEHSHFWKWHLAAGAQRELAWEILHRRIPGIQILLR